MHRAYPRTICGRTFAEFVPFSFAALNELSPAAGPVRRECRRTAPKGQNGIRQLTC